MSARLSVNINDVTAAEIRALKADKGTTATEVIRRAVAVYRLLDTEVRAGREIHLVAPGQDTTRLEIL